MVSALISRTVILVFGLLYPAYSSYKAVKTKNVKEYVKWMMYWIVFAFFTCIETFADIFVAWIPFYFEIKIIFVLWLLSPATKGASIIYRKFVHPQLAKREKDIDAYINKATDQGYTAIVSLGSKGINYATNVVLNTAVKGQAKIADHLRKSYSLNDLSGDKDDEQSVHAKDTDSENDDELDNRIIEENYQREMGEKAPEHTEDQRRLRKRRTKEAGLEKLEEEQEQEKGSRKSSSRATYSSKEAYHYATLPRSKHKTSSRPSVVPSKNNNY